MTHKLFFSSTVSRIELISTYLYVDSRHLCQVPELIIFQNK